MAVSHLQLGSYLAWAHSRPANYQGEVTFLVTRQAQLKKSTRIPPIFQIKSKRTVLMRVQTTCCDGSISLIGGWFHHVLFKFLICRGGQKCFSPWLVARTKLPRYRSRHQRCWKSCEDHRIRRVSSFSSTFSITEGDRYGVSNFFGNTKIVHRVTAHILQR